MKRFLFFRLRTRIFLIVVIPFLPAFALAIYSIGEQRKVCIAHAHRDSFSMARLIKNDYDTFSFMTHEKGLDLAVDVSHGITLLSDKRRVKQILMNLTGNAIKFTERGIVRVSARICDSRLAIDDPRIGDWGLKIEDLFASG